ncbi:MAG TPA: PQQ-dependent sugar dehydrogenase [Flavitalea sp.]|nr:PQQ-dependent sugar dehydrogenase [Flavitalea sp.]
MKFFCTLVITFYLLILTSCKSNDPANDPKIIEGKKSFTTNCGGCHELNKDAIGPALAGITTIVPETWVRKFIHDPQQMISSSDQRADSLFNTYKSIMPSFASLKEEDLTNILNYLHSEKRAVQHKAEDRDMIKDPIPEKISFGGLTINLEPVLRFPATNGKEKLPKTRITKLTSQPGIGRIFVNDLRGKLYLVENRRARVFADFVKLRPKFIAEPGLGTGLGSFDFHPDFAHNGLLYTTHTEPGHTPRGDFTYPDSIRVELQWVLTEWKLNDPKSDTLIGTGRELLRINMVSGAHGVQEIAFNPMSAKGDPDHGLLYIGIGDGASVQEGFSFIPGGKNKIWGSVIRIDPAGRNSNNHKYGIPDDNPYAKDRSPGTVREIYAYGFRNPHRFTWTKSGSMLASNIGQTNIESIYLIKPGMNAGWPTREGSFLFAPARNLNTVYPLPADDSTNHITYPLAEYDHDEGNAITGGYEYQGTKLAALKHLFLFGDIPRARIFYFDTHDIGVKKPLQIKEAKITVNHHPTTLKKEAGTNRVELRLGRDGKGEIYLMTKADGQLYRITNAHLSKGN